MGIDCRHEFFWWETALAVAQLKLLKKQVNEEMFFDFCRKCSLEKEFFIRKGIGWALREYSKSNPLVIKEFLEQEKSNHSG
jgi:3-methyladenine DNA glycosylase AlkD